ncbi:hypothetical protein DV736_g2484, partial [Chaetothyriales sp. CBS 134916]
MADTSTSQSPVHDSQPATSTHMHSLQQQVAGFFPSASPQQLNALERFLTTRVPMEKMTTITPTTDAEIRLGLAQKLQSEIRKQIQQADWQFTASQLSAILIMP